MDSIFIFGQDYDTPDTPDTPDSTCIRDYIHICDLCEAHLLAINALQSSNKSAAHNLGNRKVFSVKEVIDKANQMTGCDIPVEVAERRVVTLLV